MTLNLRISPSRWFQVLSLCAIVQFPIATINAEQPAQQLIFDTDIGNDIDDALALGVIHSLESRGECKLLAVTVSKDNPLAAQFCDLVNTFYGRGGIPVGRVHGGKTPEEGKFLRLPVTAIDNGSPRYPHTLKDDSQVPEAAVLLRKLLAAQPDKSVAIVVVGFSTNLARLLDSKPDSVSPLDGRALVESKVSLLSMMGGHFGVHQPADFKEYNIREDLPAAEMVLREWPSPIVASGYEIGLAIPYPAVSIERDFRYVAHHPLKDAYELYMKMPYDRPTWDLTSVLYAVRPKRNYFGTSDAGEISVADGGVTKFRPGGHGRHRYLTATPEQITRVGEALIQLASQPPHAASEPKK